mgnify:CR=1 FL=1
MAITATPYGLKAVNHVGGTPYAGSTRLLPIASGYASNLFNGQVVQIGTGGTIELVGTFGDGVIGKKPVNNNIVTLDYIYTHGDESNGASTFNL